MIWRKWGFPLVLVLLFGGTVAVTSGNVDPAVSLASVTEVWSDVWRDIDQVGMKLTRVSDQDEMILGKEIAGRLKPGTIRRPQQKAYVTAVGQSLVPYTRRRGIDYEFHVIDAYWVNAFAIPGGQIFVSTGLLDFLESEAELAAILGHEIAHVDLRHCIELYQYDLVMEEVGLEEIGAVVQLPHRLLSRGFSKYQELEADYQGVQLSLSAGYEPHACVTLHERFMEHSGDRRDPTPRTPGGEVLQSLEDALGSYLDSHPASEERGRRLRQLIESNRWRLAGQSFYRGVQNHQKLLPRSEQEFPSERVPF